MSPGNSEFLLPVMPFQPMHGQLDKTFIGQWIKTLKLPNHKTNTALLQVEEKAISFLQIAGSFKNL